MRQTTITRMRRARRKHRLSVVVRGKEGRPRLSVFRSNTAIYAQIIDDQAKAVGTLIAKKAKDAGISKVVFNRNVYQYHGRVKALADGAREGGLSF